MTVSYTEQELIAFLDYLSTKGLLSSATASSRKIAASKILSVLSDDEKPDLRHIDIDQTFLRFSNKFGKEFTPQSLTTYKSRFNSALSDFIRFQENPAGFKIGSSKRPSKDSSTDGRSLSKKIVTKTPVSLISDLSQQKIEPQSSFTLQIPISEGRLLEIRNMPMNLTQEDASKIANIIKAHAPTS